MSNNKLNAIKSIRLYGAGGHSQVIKETLNLSGKNVELYFDDNSLRAHFKVAKVYEGVRLKLDEFPHSGDPFIISIGNNRERAEISYLLDCQYAKAIHPTAIVSKDSIIGDGTVVFAGAVIQPNTKIGKHVIINTAASIDHDNIIGDYAHISPQAALCGHVEVGEGSHVGVGAVVIPQVKIGKWCTIGAGAVIIKDVPDYSTVVGNPGRIIKTQTPQIKNVVGDIAFVGSGIATSFTLIKFLEKIEQDYETITKPLKISIIEKSDEFHTGIPYGYRSSQSTLLIKPLSAFLPNEELDKFIAWLNHNKNWLIEETLFEGGHLTKEWYEKNKEDIEKNNWKPLYIPRHFFGKYISLIANRKVYALQNKGIVDVDFINDEVLNIEKNKEEHVVSLKNKGSIKTKKVVLGIGTAPLKNILPNTRSFSEKALLIDNPYEPDIISVFSKVKKFVERQNQKINILILGTNASSIELVYKLTDNSKIISKIDHVYTLSTLNKFPDSEGGIKDKSVDFNAVNLLNLKDFEDLKALDIYKAAIEDIESAEKKGLNAVFSTKIISPAVCNLIEKLNTEQKELFASFYGNEIGKRQREAGMHYSDSVSKLEKDKRITCLSGRFVAVSNKTKQDKGIFFDYQHPDKQITTFDKEIAVIINCTGSSKLEDNQNKNSIIGNLIDNKLCIVNKSNMGFYVNNDMEASKNLYINGPLLSGNVIDDSAVWHVEHAGRISIFSNKLANILYKQFTNESVGELIFS